MPSSSRVIKHCRPLEAHCVHDGSDIVHALVHGGEVSDAVGQTGAAFVEHDNPCKRAESIEPPGNARLSPIVVDVRHESGHKDQVDGPVAEFLVGDVNTLALGITGNWSCHIRSGAAYRFPSPSRGATPTSTTPRSLPTLRRYSLGVWKKLVALGSVGAGNRHPLAIWVTPRELTQRAERLHSAASAYRKYALRDPCQDGRIRTVSGDTQNNAPAARQARPRRPRTGILFAATRPTLDSAGSA